jgi:hypothetical protein
MSKFHSRGLTAAAGLAALLFGFAPNQAGAGAGDTDTQHQQTSPQGKDAPGAEDNGQPPMAQEDGVIKPPPTGDEGIHTEVPNPNAGPRDEIAPPPQLPGGEKVEPK